jgi:hypothetical protein
MWAGVVEVGPERRGVLYRGPRAKVFNHTFPQHFVTHEIKIRTKGWGSIRTGLVGVVDIELLRVERRIEPAEHAVGLGLTILSGTELRLLERVGKQFYIPSVPRWVRRYFFKWKKVGNHMPWPKASESYSEVCFRHPFYHLPTTSAVIRILQAQCKKTWKNLPNGRGEGFNSSNRC